MHSNNVFSEPSLHLLLGGTSVCGHVLQVILLTRWSRDPQAIIISPLVQFVSNRYLAAVSSIVHIFQTLLTNIGQNLQSVIFLTAFEAFHNGSWHGVHSIRIQNGAHFAKFVYSGSAVEHNIYGYYLRLRSRKATCLDCSHVLRPGADVCVKQASYRGDTKSSVWHLSYWFCNFRTILCYIFHMYCTISQMLCFSYVHRCHCIMMQGSSKLRKNTTQTSAFVCLLLFSTKTSALAVKENW